MLRFLVCLIFVGLSGCGAADFFSNSTGVGIPAPGTIKDYAVETVSAVTYDNGSGARMTAGEYIVASITYTNEKCHQFFELLERFKQDSEFLDKVLTAGIAAGSPLLALVGSASAADVAKFTSWVALGNQMNVFASDIYAFSSFREQLKGHVFDSMGSYQRQKGIDLMFMHSVGVRVLDGEGDVVGVRLSTGADLQISRSGIRRFFWSKEPADLIIARGVAADYAALCSLANMKKIVVDALANTKTEIKPAGTGAPATTVTNAASRPGEH